MTTHTKVRTVDNKNRITISAGATVYMEHTDENGVITLSPVMVPDLPVLNRTDFRAVYVAPPAQLNDPWSVTLFSSLGSVQQAAEDIAKLANEHKVPVVIRGRGLGSDSLAGLLADIFVRTNAVEREVILAEPQNNDLS